MVTMGGQGAEVEVSADTPTQTPPLVLGHARVASPAGLLTRAVAWLEALPEGLERQATVLCTSPLLRHRLRVHVSVELERPELLLGVRIISPARHARKVLALVGQSATLGAESIRRLRLRDALKGAGRLNLSYFDPKQVAREQGYIEAFARTIRVLEEAGLKPAELRRAIGSLESDMERRRVGDVARVWKTIEGHQGHTDATAWRQAAQLLRPAHRQRPTLVILTATPSPSLGVYLSALDPEVILHFDARPDTPTAERRLAPLGLPPRTPHTVVAPAQTELERLRSRLFMPGSAGGPGYDGTVEIEAYASVEEELEAAVAWLVNEVQRGTPLGRIALVIPQVDLLGGMLLDRLSRSEPPVPAYLAGGLPRGETPGGVRILALFDALASGLEAEATLRCLPWLRTGAHEERPGGLGLSRAAELVYGAGILGGTSRDLSAGLEWSARLGRRCDDLRARLLAKQIPEGSTAWKKAMADLADLEPLLEPIRALEELLRRMAEDEASLDVMAPELVAFLERWVVLPEHPLGIMDHIGQEIERLVRDRTSRRLRGRAALAAIRGSIARERAPIGRLDEGVFVGTPRHCVGVEFEAVRFMGLAEGIFPRLPHDDPVLPSDLRARLEGLVQGDGPGRIIRRMEDELDDDLHTFCRVVGGTTGRLALSIPRQWLDRTERAMSGLVLEVLNALGTNVEGASRVSDLSSLGHLHTERLRPGVARTRALMLAQGATPRAAFTARRARYEADGHVPADWLLEHELKLFAHVDAPDTALKMPGLDPEHPLSPSWLRMLLRCPFQFLQEKILERAPTDARPPTDRLEPRAFGTLVHDACEDFFEARGARLCAQQGTLDEHMAAARKALEGAFERTLGSYPLRGGDTAERELERAWRVMAEVVRREWARPARTFDAVELGFGFGEHPVALTVGEDDKLYLRGRIDRVDRLEEGYSVRDLKTGRGRSLREEGLSVSLDLQLGLYTRVLEDVVRPDAPVVEAAYTHPAGGGAPERAFRGDGLTALRARTDQWLQTAVGLLQARVFPRTTSKYQCRYCAFRPMCGDDAPNRSAAALAQTEQPALVAFRQMKEAEDG